MGINRADLETRLNAEIDRIVFEFTVHTAITLAAALGLSATVIGLMIRAS